MTRDPWLCGFTFDQWVTRCWLRSPLACHMWCSASDCSEDMLRLDSSISVGSNQRFQPDKENELHEALREFALVDELPHNLEPPRTNDVDNVSAVDQERAQEAATLTELPVLMDCPTERLRSVFEGTERFSTTKYLMLPEGQESVCFDEGLIVQQSTIPNAGFGLFTEQRIPAGTTICQYLGDTLTLRDMLRRSDRTFMMGIAINQHIDAGPHPNVSARYINDNHPEKLNCKFVKNKRNWSAHVIATRDIEANEELFVSYGEGYWRGLKTTPWEHMSPLTLEEMKATVKLKATGDARLVAAVV